MKKEKNVKVDNLLNNEKDIIEVSKWIWDEWDKENGYKLEDIIYRTKHSLNENKIPKMFIAKIEDEIVGVVSLWMNDLNSRQDLYPWLATLIVKPKYRNLGIGKLLQETCIEEVKKMNYEYLYLITDHKNYYEKTGWEFFDNAPLRNGKITNIYRYKL